MKKLDLYSAIERALLSDVSDEGDTDKIIEMIFDGVIKILQRDARFPYLTRTDYDMLFADLTKETCEALLPYQKIDAENAAGIITDAAIDAMSEENADEHRENPEADQVAVVHE